MDKEKILDKIRKCMALAKSGNEHEAAAALRQARALMESNGISEAEMLAIGVGQKSTKAGALDRPAQWEHILAQGIACAFGCRLIFVSGPWTGEWTFYGCGPSAEISTYAFEVLLRQARKARKAHIDNELRRYKKANKTRRADLFCLGWVSTALSSVSAWSSSESTKEALDAYQSIHFPDLGTLETRDRNEGRCLSDKDYQSLASGRESGKSAEFNQGVGAAPSPLQLEG